MVPFLIRQAKVWNRSKRAVPPCCWTADPRWGAYVDYTLGNLVSEELEGSGVKVELESKPIFEGILPYAVKYRETSWQFLSRMAALCGEWFLSLEMPL
ncbi:MAG TPA: hypothetical protein DEG09_02720 [Marinilabiliaceae bacterium]|nr:hypothetical protein [Marinilabiliaceae bacterium]